jgi:curved DNA-binding protein CbpA
VPETESLYAILDVAQDATPEAIKQAWRRAATAAHPDRPGGSAERMSQVNQAYEVLSDPERRAGYDQNGDTRRSEALQNARAMLRNEFRKAMEVKGGEDADLVGLVKHALTRIEMNAKNARVATQAQLRLLERRMRRLKGPTLDNLFLEVMTEAHDEATRGLRTIDEAMEAVAVANTIVGQYSWDMFADAYLNAAPGLLGLGQMNVFPGAGG